MGAQLDRLICRIYDAAEQPALWDDVLVGIADAVGGGPANMTELDIVTGEGIGRAVRTDTDAIDRYFTRWAGINPLAIVDDADAYAAAWHLDVLRDDEMVERSRLVRTDYHNEFLRPIEAAYSLAVRVSLDGTRVSSIGVGRSERRGRFADEEVAALRLLQPHIVRAISLHRRLQGAVIGTSQIDMLLRRAPGAMLFVDAFGVATRLNAAAEALLVGGDPLALGPGRRVRGASARAEGLVRALLGPAPWPGDAAGADRSVRIDGRTGSLRITASLIGDRDAEGVPACDRMLVALEPLQDARASMGVAYGLTAAEERVAFAVGRGERPSEIAARRGCSVNTVRTQLGAIFAKTRCHSQSDLVRLMLRTGFVQDDR